MNLLDQLKNVTCVVADTGDFERMKKFMPKDATTNPTLILKAAQLPAYRYLIDSIIKKHPNATTDELIDQLLVAFGVEILQIIPGRVSTEIDAELSFDIQASVTKAHRIIQLYEAVGIKKDRILIKIAATWEGIQAAKILESEGIHCNLTLVFNLIQAVTCADSNVQLISPFIGRITDWSKKNLAEQWNEASMSGVNDPGVLSTSKIYNYFKYFDISTEIMGASFRNIEQIQSLAGCDLLTISPELLEQLQQTESDLTTQLSVATAKSMSFEPIKTDEISFRKMMNSDAMATEKLAEGIRNFIADTKKLRELLETLR
ncbi:transaldolase [Polynucleobacter kasalickyi]|uniref:Transaldolase n=1 Tax=Polynucleobacter kasalickyi TaxID=1938817 RepID=A0A1W2B1A5_9BURK|nr:transaldolase [Polynucleobacter kasalickyi]SMC66719.1 transaldolase [Polynucleobacter kasalickyi]